MSELNMKFNLNKFEMVETDNMSFNVLEQDKEDMSEPRANCDEPEQCLKQQQMEQNLKQLQRRQSIVYQHAQEQVKVLQNLLKSVDSDWAQARPEAPVMSNRHVAPQAYRFKDIYEHNKQQLLRDCLEKERAQRQFHSRPMPNFQQVHQLWANRQVTHRITCPLTPKVLKTSQDMERKRCQKVDQQLQQREQEQAQLQKQRPQAKPVPSYDNPWLLKPGNGQGSNIKLEMKPFRLSTELRAEQRKQFNTQVHQQQEIKRREQQEQRLRLEREQQQKLRELATFRARPNPFKNHLEAILPSN